MKDKNSSKNLKKGFVPIWILVVLAIVATIGSGVAFFVLKGTLGPGGTSSTNTGTPPPPPPPPPVADPTANWKVYENLEWGFRIKYPSSWAVEESDNPGFLGFVALLKSAPEEDSSLGIYTNFNGGFECEEVETVEDIPLRGGGSVEREVLRPVVDGDICGPVEDLNGRTVIVNIEGIGGSDLIIGGFNALVDGALETIDLIISTFEIL